MGVDVDLFSSGNRCALRRELPATEYVILFVGRLVEKKGCRDLVEAFSLLPADIRARTTVWVVGDGDRREELEAYSRRCGIGEKARFWRTVSNHLLPDYYAAADLFVAPSIEAASGDTEGLGVVLLEAFAAKLCVIATRVGGMGEVVSDGVTGLLVHSRNPKLLATAIEKLLRDEPLRARLAATAFATVKQKYSWEKVAEEFADLYEQVRRCRASR
jgi:glycosyltransferase involved in cell wall biosynthesis